MRALVKGAKQKLGRTGYSQLSDGSLDVSTIDPRLTTLTTDPAIEANPVASGSHSLQQRSSHSSLRNSDVATEWQSNWPGDTEFEIYNKSKYDKLGSESRLLARFKLFTVKLQSEATFFNVKADEVAVYRSRLIAGEGIIAKTLVPNQVVSGPARIYANTSTTKFKKS